MLDLETSSLDINTAQILEIGAVCLHPQTLNICSEFSSKAKPEDWNLVEASALAVNKLTKEELETAPDIKIVFAQFTSWVQQFARNNKSYSKNNPVCCGFNIDNYDLPIINRYCKRFGPYSNKRNCHNLFNQIYTIDVQKLMWWLTESHSGLPNLKQSTILEYMGVPAIVLEKSHRALFDCQMCAVLVQKLFGLSRYLTKQDAQGNTKLKIKNCLASLYENKQENPYCVEFVGKFYP